MVLLKWNHSVSLSILESSYKVREQSLLPSTSHHRMRSTQSDTALLPTDVYFQRTLSPVSVHSKTGSRAGRRRGSKVRSFHMHLCCLLVHFKEHLLLLFSANCKVFHCFPGGRNDQDSRPGYWGGPQYEEDHRQNGQETVSGPRQGETPQETAQHAATRGQETPRIITSSTQISLLCCRQSASPYDTWCRCRIYLVCIIRELFNGLFMLSYCFCTWLYIYNTLKSLKSQWKK